MEKEMVILMTEAGDDINQLQQDLTSAEVALD